MPHKLIGFDNYFFFILINVLDIHFHLDEWSLLGI